jgi:predicted nucleic acid-binding protein
MSTERRRCVIDADATIALVRHGSIERLSRDWAFVAPSLLWSECRNVLHRAMYRPGATGEEPDIFDRIVRAPIARIDDVPPRSPWDIADVLGWPKTYDAEYLAVASRESIGVFSFDRRLRAGARRLGIELVTPA